MVCITGFIAPISHAKKRHPDIDLSLSDAQLIDEKGASEVKTSFKASIPFNVRSY